MFKGFLIALALLSAAGSYPAGGTVTGVIEGGPYADDVVMVRTAADMVYICQADDLRIGDTVAMIMSDAGTPYDVTDDIITDIRFFQ